MKPISRKEFIKSLTLSSAFVLGGGSISASAIFHLRKKVKLRFVVASDGHYGQPNTPFDQMHDTLIAQVNAFHASNPLDFCVINGDVIHDQKELLVPAKKKIDQLKMPYYVTKGNHDKVSDAYWGELWNMPVNHSAAHKDNQVILATTSDETGKYLSPDLDWMKTKLDESHNFKNTFIFIHIPQAKWTANGIDTPAFFELMKKYPKIRGVFHGHEHDQDGIKMHENIPFLFDSHFGGNWGTDYKGFRVVEVMSDQKVITYMMNPTVKMIEASI